MEDKGAVVQGLLEHGTEWQNNFENVIKAVEKTLEEK
jgi:ATP-binding protein involved in chromosome partitioning